MVSRRYRRQARPNPKPYGFCCFPTDDVLPRHGLDTSLASIHSMHECPALKIRTQEIVKRPKASFSKDGINGSRINLALGLNLQSSEGGGMKLKDMTESMIDLMIDIQRAQRQAEYEERMDRLASIGARKTQERKAKKLKCGPPCWYTDYSLSQLQHLRDLEDAMFKDKKENTINRTSHCLASIGMTTDLVTVDSHILRKLMNEYSTDIKTFICEVYKAIRGNYFEDEGIRLDYTTHERIMISGVVFLELPHVILELHKRMPPIIKFKFPTKPEKSHLIIAKKRPSPLLEKLYPPVNWRLYATRLLKWRKKCAEIPRPIAMLPKETKEIVDKNAENEDKKDENQIDTKTEKSKVTVLKSSNDEKNNTQEEVNESVKKDSRHVSAITEGHQSDTPLFTIENPWTEPPTPCPMKFIKRFRENPLKTDSEFFTQLNRPACKNQVSTSFRLQSVLLEAEADLYGLMHEAHELTGEVTRLAKEILEPDLGCDACCSCRETRRAHLMRHATKAPYAIVDGVVKDEKNKTQVIGAMAMHSPAESIASVNEPPVVPSCEKFMKNRVITGTTTMIDGEPVNQIGGVIKTLEHVSQEVLLPDVDVVEVKNVPPCGCRDQKKDEELEKQVLSTTKDEGLCYGKKYRPKEGPTYTCSEFGKKDEQEDCGCGEDDDECGDEEEFDEVEGCYEDDDCGCGSDAGKCGEVDLTVRKTPKKQVVTCKRCGRELDPKCIDIGRKLDKSKSSLKGKRVTNKCSCDSLSEFLQMDIGKTKCIMPKKIYYSKQSAKSKTKKSGKAQKNAQKAPKEKVPRMKISKGERSKRSSQVVLKTEPEKEGEDEKEDSQQESVDESGPYGYRTKSEEALPIVRTLAYLTDPHPPTRPAERIPVREGGRPCRCRENRNNRKTLMYGIGALVDEKNNNDEENGTRVIEGLTYLTPEPSIRGSDEYIPEYELADSPYEKQICGALRKGAGKVKGQFGGGRKDGDNDADRTGDWENAIQDEYLTEFFTKERDGVPCWTNCSKFKKKKETAPRKLKVMKPVCECKYERRIVKRNEERQKWRDRQQRLKSLDKEAFLHIDDIAQPELSECSDVTHAVTVISAVTMQTPCDTPEVGRSRSHLPYAIQVDIEMKKSDETKDTTKREKRLSKEEKEIENESKKNEVEKEVVKERDGGKKKVDVDAIGETDEDEDEVEEIEFTARMGKRTSFFDLAEEELTQMMNGELEKMAVEEDFVSLKLPNYHKLLQLSYWISYRVRGVCFTEKYKNELMKASLKKWNSKALADKPSVESLKLSKKDRRKLNYDHAKYWKRKIGKLTRKFYAKARQDAIEIGRQMWPTMEFGKFPHLLFKQAYYTYLPPREVDIYAFRTYLMK